MKEITSEQQYFIDYRLSHPELKEYKKGYREIRKKIIEEYLKDKKCHLCGDNNPKHLVFHHTNPGTKENIIANLLNGKIEKLLEEMNKWVVVCVNCHVKFHYIENPRKIRTKLAKRFEREYKELVGCKICGENFGPCLQYHHINPDEKINIISDIQNIKDVIIEIEKCEVLCGNCHGALRK
jgi:translation elongation factor EF-Ts